MWDLGTRAEQVLRTIAFWSQSIDLSIIHPSLCMCVYTCIHACVDVSTDSIYYTHVPPHIYVCMYPSVSSPPLYPLITVLEQLACHLSAWTTISDASAKVALKESSFEEVAGLIDDRRPFLRLSKGVMECRTISSLSNSRLH